MRFEPQRVPQAPTLTLEVDVMRFIAILGFCLLAIFSVANLEEKDTGVQSTTEQEVTSQIAPNQAETNNTRADAPPAPKTENITAQPMTRSESDWILVFADADSLSTLIDIDKVRLFATTDSATLELTSTRPRIARTVPSSLRALVNETVPPAFKLAVQDVPIQHWRVWLDGDIEAHIAVVQSVHDDGTLIIERTGTVLHLPH